MVGTIQVEVYSKSERFEVAFNIIHQRLQKIMKGDENRFVPLLYNGRKEHKMIDKYFDELKQYAKLRNSLVHDKTELGTYIAEPHEEIVERIEEIARVFSKPIYALSLATTDIVSFTVNDSIRHVIETYKEYQFSQYPVYEGKICIGLLKIGEVLCWLADYFDQPQIYLDKTTLQSLSEMITMKELLFLDKSVDVFALEDFFAERHKTESNLEVVLITENGSMDEAPLGIISSWDLIEIDYTID